MQTVADTRRLWLDEQFLHAADLATKLEKITKVRKLTEVEELFLKVSAAFLYLHNFTIDKDIFELDEEHSETLH